MSFNNNRANRLVNLTILLSHTKENEFRKIVSGQRKFTENFVITLKEMRRKYHALRTYVAVVIFFLSNFQCNLLCTNLMHIPLHNLQSANVRLVMGKESLAIWRENKVQYSFQMLHLITFQGLTCTTTIYLEMA